MGSMLGDWPSYDPHNFSQLRPSDPSNPSKMALVTYHPTHDRTLPPPNQDRYLKINREFLSGSKVQPDAMNSVICSEAKNILLRHFYQQAEDKLRPKRAASECLTQEHRCKHARASASDTSPN